MSLTTPEETSTEVKGGRKRTAQDAELEIDVNAPEPPSKKALRKAKRLKDGKVDIQASPDQKSKIENNPLKQDRAATSGDEGKRSDYGIWIGNLSFTTTKQDILNHLINDQHHVIKEPQITRINLPMSVERKAQNKGFAYVDLDSSETVQTALELSETLLGGRRVLIKDAKNFEGRPKASKTELAAQGKAPSKRVFVGNLGFEMTVERLEEHFGVCGQILDTKMATFEDSGKCKGFAWIDFEHISSAEAAMRGWVETSRVGGGKQKTWLHSMDGRKLRTEFAEDKTTRYNKRFGKNAKPKSDGSDLERQAEDQTEGIVEIPDEAQQRNVETPRKAKKPDTKNRSAASRNGSRYGTETVQKLTGAIVEGQGKKMVFD